MSKMQTQNHKLDKPRNNRTWTHNFQLELSHSFITLIKDFAERNAMLHLMLYDKTGWYPTRRGDDQP